MNKLNMSLPELLNMLKVVESHLKGDKAQLLSVDGKKKQAMKKGTKRKLNPKKSIKKKKKAKRLSNDGSCFFYGKKRHWKKKRWMRFFRGRNCQRKQNYTRKLLWDASGELSIR